MPTRALLISSIDLRVASLGGSPSSLITRSTFSTTTMASSTSRPMARTMANIVSMLMEKPNSASTPKVPGARRARRWWGPASPGGPRKRNITRKTRTTASIRV